MVFLTPQRPADERSCEKITIINNPIHYNSHLTNNFYHKHTILLCLKHIIFLFLLKNLLNLTGFVSLKIIYLILQSNIITNHQNFWTVWKLFSTEYKMAG